MSLTIKHENINQKEFIKEPNFRISQINKELFLIEKKYKGPIFKPCFLGIGLFGYYTGYVGEAWRYFNPEIEFKTKEECLEWIAEYNLELEKELSDTNNYPIN
jgi:hypothetical protein